MRKRRRSRGPSKSLRRKSLPCPAWPSRLGCRPPRRFMYGHRMEDDSRLTPVGKYPGEGEPRVSEIRLRRSGGRAGRHPDPSRGTRANLRSLRPGWGMVRSASRRTRSRREGCRCRGCAVPWDFAASVAPEVGLQGVDRGQQRAGRESVFARSRRVDEIGLVPTYMARERQSLDRRAPSRSREISPKAPRMSPAPSPILEPRPRNTRAIG